MKRLPDINRDYDKIKRLLHYDKEAGEELLRQLRAPLLIAYDSYKSSVVYEGLNETPEEKEKILQWKAQILKLEIDSIRDVPSVIKYYVKEVGKWKK